MRNISTAIRGHYDNDRYMWAIIIRRFCDTDANNEGASSGPKKKRTTKKSSVKQVSSDEDEEEEGYTKRKSLALSMWYLLVIDHLRAIFVNPKDAKLMS
jgi:hypothetical protein